MCFSTVICEAIFRNSFGQSFCFAMGGGGLGTMHGLLPIFQLGEVERMAVERRRYSIFNWYIAVPTWVKYRGCRGQCPLHPLYFTQVGTATRDLQENRIPIFGRGGGLRPPPLPKMGILLIRRSLSTTHKITCNCWISTAKLHLPNHCRLFCARF